MPIMDSNHLKDPPQLNYEELKLTLGGGRLVYLIIYANPLWSFILLTTAFDNYAVCRRIRYDTRISMLSDPRSISKF